MIHIQYLKDQTMRIMDMIEEETEVMIQDLNASLEARFWAAVDSNNGPALQAVYNEFCKMLDTVRAGNYHVI